MIARNIDRHEIMSRISQFPVTAILGPRQCGKTTIARQLEFDHYFDLENPRDMVSMEQPQLTLEDLKGLIIIDEIQRIPELFPLIRYLADTNPQQKYLILGSASRDLIRQSSESLAGRIAYFHMGGFRIHDIAGTDIKKLWFRGPLPDSFTPDHDEQSRLWRENYISTFLEKDIPQLGINIPARTLRRFWNMLAHYHGQILNYAELGRSFGISDMTIRKYIDILEGTFMVRLLQPWHVNIGKRVVKSPKVYLKDSGIFHSLMNIDSPEQLYSHPKLGASWEGFALECVSRAINKPEGELYFWRIHSGSELDFFWRQGGKNWGVEFKYATAPGLSRSMNIVAKDLQLEHLWVIYPGDKTYPLSEKITALPLREIPPNWQYQ